MSGQSNRNSISTGIKYRVVQCWEAFWQLFTRPNMCLPCNPTIPHLGVDSRDVKRYPKWLEEKFVLPHVATIWKIQMSINRRPDELWCVPKLPLSNTPSHGRPLKHGQARESKTEEQMIKFCLQKQNWFLVSSGTKLTKTEITRADEKRMWDRPGAQGNGWFRRPRSWSRSVTIWLYSSQDAQNSFRKFTM